MFSAVVLVVVRSEVVGIHKAVVALLIESGELQNFTDITFVYTDTVNGTDIVGLGDTGSSGVGAQSLHGIVDFLLIGLVQLHAESLGFLGELQNGGHIGLGGGHEVIKPTAGSGDGAGLILQGFGGVDAEIGGHGVVPAVELVVEVGGLHLGQLKSLGVRGDVLAHEESAGAQAVVHQQGADEYHSEYDADDGDNLIALFFFLSGGLCLFFLFCGKLARFFVCLLVAVGFSHNGKTVPFFLLFCLKGREKKRICLSASDNFIIIPYVLQKCYTSFAKFTFITEKYILPHVVLHESVHNFLFISAREYGILYIRNKMPKTIRKGT